MADRAERVIQDYVDNRLLFDVQPPAPNPENDLGVDPRASRLGVSLYARPAKTLWRLSGVSQECFASLIREVRALNYKGQEQVGDVMKPSYLLTPERLAHDIAATLAIFRISNNYTAMAQLLGCGRNTLAAIVDRVSCVLTPILEKELEEIVNHPNNRADSWLFPGKSVRFSTDTFPLECWSSEKSNQPKYAGDVVKVPATTTHSGFFCSVGKCLYSGASHDQIIIEYEQLPERLREMGTMSLADGVFKASDVMIVPFNKTTVAKATEEDKREGEAMLRHNAAIQVLRARTEHCYSRVQFGRWKGLTRWDHGDELLFMGVRICAGLLNKEMFLRHGYGGRYGPLMHCKRKQASALYEIRQHTVYNQRFKVKALRLSDEDEDRLCGATYDRGVCEGSLFLLKAETVMDESRSWDDRKAAGKFLLEYFGVRSARRVQQLQADYPDAFAQ